MAVSRLTQTTLQNGFEKFNRIWDERSAVGSMEAISAITLSAAQASVDFNNIPGTYSHLQVRYLSRSTLANDSTTMMRINSDKGNNYGTHMLYGSGSTAGSQGQGSIPFIELPRTAYGATGSNIFGGGIVDILDYSNTNKYKTIRVFGGCDENGSGGVALVSGLWISTSAITAVHFFPTGGSPNIHQSSSYTLYGIK